MRITRRAEKINLNHVVDVSVDVHKETLYFFFEIGGHEYSDECQNRTSVIEKRLQRYHAIAFEHNKKSLRIICEPTGQYQNKLFRTARRLGFMTCYVNAESVAKFRLIETNDMNKTDTKDPRVISSLGKLNKTLRLWVSCMERSFLCLSHPVHLILKKVFNSIMKMLRYFTFYIEYTLIRSNWYKRVSQNKVK